MADLPNMPDIVNELGDAASRSIERIVAAFEKGASKSSDIAKHLDAIAKNSKDFEGKFKSGKDLQKAMLKDSKLFDQVQKQILKSQKQSITEYYNKAAVKVSQKVKTMAQEKEILEEMQDIQNDSTSSLEEQLELMKGQVKEQSKMQKMWEGLKKYIAGAALAALKGFKSAIDAKDFQSAVEGITEPFQELISTIPVLGPLLNGAFDILKKMFFTMWDHIEKRVLPVNKMLIEQFGAIEGGVRGVRKEAIGMGMRFEALGMDFKEGAASVVEFSAALKTIDPKGLSKGWDELGIRLTKVVQLSAEQAGKLAVAFDRGGSSLDGLNTTMAQAEITAKAYGVPVNQIRKDMGENIDVVQRFGIANRTKFLEAASVARLYGTSIKEVTAAFGDNMDSFDKTADVAAKLNTIFGTNINSLELMMETDPTKRMAMLSKELLKQGKSWEQLNVFEKKIIKTNFGVDDSTGALILSEKNLGKSQDAISKKLKAQNKEKEKARKANENWERSISRLRQTLLNWQLAIEKIILALGRVISKFLGIKNMGVENVAQMVQQALSGIEKWISSGQMERDIGKLINKIKAGIKAVSIFVDPIMNLMRKFEHLTGESKQYTQQDMFRSMPVNALGAILRKGETFSGEKLTEKQKGDISELITEKLRQQILAESVDANDALITKTGQIVSFHPQDNIVATKADPTSLLAGGVNNDALLKEVQMLRKAIENGTKIEMAEVTMDARRVGEAMVRISRY